MTASPATPTRIDGLRPARVLVVEDSPDHRMLIARALRGTGSEVHTAETGEEALALLDEVEVDVVLVDQRLPRMSGAELLAEVVDRPHAPAAVVVTGAGSEELVVEALRLGAVDYVVKSPDYLAELPAVVARAHAQHDLARRYRQLQRFALLVHEPTAREDTLAEIVHAARRLLRAHGAVLARRDATGRWAVAASAGAVDEPALLDWLARRDLGGTLQAVGHVVVDLPSSPDEPAGVLVVLPAPGVEFLDEEAQLVGTFAGFAASALRQVRRLELERELVRELQQSVRVREDFLASVSHELRTPLTVITGYAETLLDRGDEIEPAMHDHLLRRVVHSGEELRRLIDQLLDVASLQHGRQLDARVETLDLSTLVAEVVDELAYHLRDRAGERRVPSMSVRVDPTLLRRTLANLISNACKYSDHEAPVSVRASRVDVRVRVEVVDEGIGVPVGDASHVFEPFWRGPEAVAGAVRGTGIGLALVREYVDAMGGDVGLRPREDGPGSVFWFSVPAGAEVASGADGPAVEGDREVGAVDGSRGSLDHTR